MIRLTGLVPSKYSLLFLFSVVCHPACGDARYRLDGQVDEAFADIPSRIALLDSTASQKVTTLHKLYTTASDSLRQSITEALLLIDEELSNTAPPIKTGERRLRSARNAYSDAFKAMAVHVSFGGNLVFGREDQRVRTEVLLEEIQDRFYKGKAFSLETGSQIRRTIRKKLIPAEKRVDRVGVQLRKLQSARKVVQSRRNTFEQAVTATEGNLIVNYNRRVLDRIEGGVLTETELDSTGSYSFENLAEGRYHLYLRTNEPKLLGVLLDGHRSVLMTPGDPSPLISSE